MLLHNSRHYLDSLDIPTANEVDSALLVAARHELLLYDLTHWAEDIQLRYSRRNVSYSVFLQTGQASVSVPIVLPQAQHSTVIAASHCGHFSRATLVGVSQAGHATVGVDGANG